MNLYYAFPVVMAIGSFALFLKWDNTVAIDWAIKTALFFFFVWSCLESADRLGYVDVYRQEAKVTVME